MADADLLYGTLDLLILKTIALGPRHGWGISKRIREMSRDVLQVNQGSLYPALYRLEQQGLLASEDGTSPEGRRVRNYRITAAGRRTLASETERWQEFALAVGWVLKTT